MSESSQQDKTEKATPRKKSKAREKGDVPRNKDLTSMAVMGGIDAATSQQTASLVMQSLGGSNLTAGGVGWEGESFACPPNTAVSELLNQGVNQGTMSTIASSTGNGGNANTGVVASAFP